MCLMRVAAGQDERGEVRVVVMRAQAQRALAGLDVDLDESRAAALIALTGGLDGYRRGVSSWRSVTVDRNPAAALSLTRAGSFDSVGGGQVQVALNARRKCAAGLRASRGDRSRQQ